MAPEFASNVAHCDHIPVSLIKLRPRVKLGTRNRLNLLVGEVDIFDAAWWAEQQRLRFFESPTMEDTALLVTHTLYCFLLLMLLQAPWCCV